MNISYKREMRHNYLILEAEEAEEESFEIRMLTENTIEGLLKFRIKQEEMGRYYCYEITSKQPLSRILEFKEIKKEELSRLIIEIGAVLKRIEDYLLLESGLLLEPEHIYIEPESYRVWLCYIPGYGKSFPEAMEKFLQYLLKKTNHKDNGAVVLAYRLYQESQKDYYGIEDLLRIVRENQQETPQKAARNMGIENVEVSEKGEKVLDGENQKYQKGRGKIVGEAWKGEMDAPAEPWDGGKRAGWKVLAVSLSIIIAGPLLVWLYAGTAGLLFWPYQAGLLAVDLGAVSGALLYLWKKKQNSVLQKKRAKGAQKASTAAEKESEWQMTFEESFDEEEQENEKEILENGREDLRWEKDRDTEISGKKGEDTVLLAEASPENEQIHLLKSVNPSIPDIPVPYFPFIIGKQEGIVDYVLKKDTVSRIHLRMDEEDGICRVTDLNSSNGTVVEDYRLEANESHILCSGDKLTIADVSFLFY